MEERKMKMVVYADMVFLLNLCIDYLLLWLTAVIRRQQVSSWRLLLAALLGAGYAAMYLWPSFSLFYSLSAKIFFAVLMVWTAFGFVSPISFLRTIGVFTLSSFVIGGGMFALHYIVAGKGQVAGGIFLTQSAGWGSPVSWLFVLIAFPLIWLYARYSFRSMVERESVGQYLAQVVIHIGSQKIECTGLIDTGNQLRDPVTRSPVMMVELEQMQPYLPSAIKSAVEEEELENLTDSLSPDWIRRIQLIPFRAIGNKGGLLLTLKTDQVEIIQGSVYHQRTDVLVGLDTSRLSSDGTYQAIIHPSCVIKAG